MTQEQNRHLLELIVNSSAKQQGNFTKTSELVSRLLQEHFVASSVSIWLFDEKFESEQPVTENQQTSFNSCSKRLIAHYCQIDLNQSKPAFDTQQSEIQFSFFDELRRHRFIAADNISAETQLIHSFEYYQHLVN